MKLARSLSQAIVLFMITIIVVVFGVLIKFGAQATYAEKDGELDTFVTEGAKFVTFYDNGEKLTIKTEAATVGEAIEKVGIIINEGDRVEPGMEAEINADNFFVNIYRARPVIIKDGKIEKYLMTASYDLKTIAAEAGITVYDGDEIDLVPNTSFLEAGAANVYRITRNGGRTLTVEEEVPFPERTEKDYNLAPGVSEVRQLGEVGVKKLTYNILYVDNEEVSRELVSEEIVKNPVERVVAVGASAIERTPLTAGKGRNRYTTTVADGRTVERQETYYDLDMGVVIRYCGVSYTVRDDGVKVDQDGYVLVAANLTRYPRCSVVETSLGTGKVYDTGGFAAGNPEQFDIATDWSNNDGR